MLLNIIIQSSDCTSKKKVILSLVNQGTRSHLGDRYIGGYEHEALQNPISENNIEVPKAPQKLNHSITYHANLSTLVQTFQVTFLLALGNTETEVFQRLCILWQYQALHDQVIHK